MVILPFLYKVSALLLLEGKPFPTINIGSVLSHVYLDVRPLVVSLYLPITKEAKCLEMVPCPITVDKSPLALLNAPKEAEYSPKARLLLPNAVEYAPPATFS